MTTQIPPNPISFSDVQTEFGGTNPVSLTEYYGATSYLPASGQISLADFRGADAKTYTKNSSDWRYDTVNSFLTIFWGGATIYNAFNVDHATLTELTVGDYTYYREAFQEYEFVGDPPPASVAEYYHHQLSKRYSA